MSVIPGSRKTWLRIVRWGGVALMAIGTAIVSWTLAAEPTTSPTEDFLLESYQRLGLAAFCLAMVVVGAIAVAYSALARYKVTVDEAYQLGRDIGFEEGHRAGRRIAKPVVVDLTHEPDSEEIVVDLKDGPQPPEIRIRMPLEGQGRAGSKKWLPARRRHDRRQQENGNSA